MSEYVWIISNAAAVRYVFSTFSPYDLKLANNKIGRKRLPPANNEYAMESNKFSVLSPLKYGFISVSIVVFPSSRNCSIDALNNLIPPPHEMVLTCHHHLIL